MRTLRRLLTQTWRAVRIPLLVAGLIVAGDTLSEIDCNFDGVPGYKLYLVPHNAPGSHDSYTPSCADFSIPSSGPNVGLLVLQPVGNPSNGFILNTRGGPSSTASTWSTGT
jgi:hypothetical protein